MVPTLTQDTGMGFIHRQLHTPKKFSGKISMYNQLGRLDDTLKIVCIWLFLEVSCQE